jgi:hypothetical protein
MPEMRQLQIAIALSLYGFLAGCGLGSAPKEANGPIIEATPFTPEQLKAEQEIMRKQQQGR